MQTSLFIAKLVGPMIVLTGLIGLATLTAQPTRHVAVVVPAGMIHLNESDPAFGQSAGQ